MIVRIEYLHMPVSESMNDRVQRKLDKLGDKFDSIVKAEVTFKQENDPAGQGKSCAIEVSDPGIRLYVRNYSDNFEKSFNESMRELKRKLRKRKTSLKRNRGVTS